LACSQRRSSARDRFGIGQDRLLGHLAVEAVHTPEEHADQIVASIGDRRVDVLAIDFGVSASNAR
jgi:hypothetical protein